METRDLTIRPLLILVLTACRDSGYETVSSQRIVNALKDLQEEKHPLVPKLAFGLSAMKPFCPEVNDALSALHMSGQITFNAIGATITVTDDMSDAEVLKPLLDAEREQIRTHLPPYIADFVRHISRADPKAPKPKRNPQET